MDSNFVCPICGNTSAKYIGYRNGKPYCRRCISYRGEEVKGDIAFPKSAYFKLSYELSDDQKRLSKQLIDNYKNGKNTLVHAVCGSGKTEIVLNVIQYAINCGERVGFAIPRRDVVIEIYKRFKEIFKRNKIVCVYGGHTDDLIGDLVVLTTHQLYRYNNYFDLLIVDEIDAFPFNGNEVLAAFFEKSIRNHYIMMSATPSKEILTKFSKDNNEVVELFSRFHMHKLPVPQVIIKRSVSQFIELFKQVKRFISLEKQVFIFAPTIEICEEIFKILSIFIKNGNYVHSKCVDRTERIESFRNMKIMYLVTTAVLERGVTVKDLQVIVYNSDHILYTSYALIQIAGRVGRKMDAPDGEVIFLTSEKTNEINEAIREIKRANETL